MLVRAQRGLLSIVSQNQLLTRYIFGKRLGYCITDLSLDLDALNIDRETWKSDEKIREIVCKVMPVVLRKYHFPKTKISTVIDECLEEYAKIPERSISGISKVTGKVMSDSLNGSFEKMKKQLPDVLIPDFVKYMHKLEAFPPISAKHEPEWQSKGVWYNSQKQHVMGWIRSQMTHGGETEYHRDNLNISSRTSYNRWNNPGMALWLAEALGAEPDAVEQAQEEAFNEPDKRRRSGIVRKHFTFDVIIELLSKDPDGEKIIIRTQEELDEKIKKYI